MQANNIFKIGIAKTGVTIDPVREHETTEQTFTWKPQICRL